MFEIDKLTRDKNKVFDRLNLVKGKALLTKDDEAYIIIPSRYREVNMAQYGSDNKIYGIYALVVGNYYTVSNINGMVSVDPYKITQIKYDDVSYDVLIFQPESTIIKTLKIVKQEALIYNVFDNFLIKGKIPFYIEYQDILKLFDTAKEHAGSRIGENIRIIELITSILARNPTNPNEYYRTINKGKPFYVGFNSVQSGTMTSMNKILGAYSGEGVISSIVSPTEGKTQDIERFLRQ